MSTTATIESTDAGGFAGYSGMTPPDWILWGVLLSASIVGLPVGLPMLIMGIVRLRDPVWQVRIFTKWAAKDPADASELLGRALAVAPDSVDLVKPLATWYCAQGDYAQAFPYLRRYVATAPADWTLRAAHATAALKLGYIDEAIAELEALRSEAPLDPDSHASATAHLAYAQMAKEDPDLALGLLGEEKSPLGKTGPGGEQCLFYRAVARYLTGRTKQAIADLDHLYGLNAAYDGLAAAKTAMGAGTFELLLPDGSALVPLTTEEAKVTVKRVRRQSASPHCDNCGALRQPGDLSCRYCSAVLG